MKSILEQIIERNEKNLKELKELKKETLELLESDTRLEIKSIELMNNIIALFNREIKIYNNFSIQSFEHLLRNANFEEFKEVLKKLEPNKTYIIKDNEELKDYMNFLEEEGEFLLHDEIQKIIVKVNENLFYFEAIQKELFDMKNFIAGKYSGKAVQDLALIGMDLDE